MRSPEHSLKIERRQGPPKTTILHSAPLKNQRQIEGSFQGNVPQTQNIVPHIKCYYHYSTMMQTNALTWRWVQFHTAPCRLQWWRSRPTACCTPPDPPGFHCCSRRSTWRCGWSNPGETTTHLLHVGKHCLTLPWSSYSANGRINLYWISNNEAL